MVFLCINIFHKVEPNLKTSEIGEEVIGDHKSMGQIIICQKQYGQIKGQNVCGLETLNQMNETLW